MKISKTHHMTVAGRVKRNPRTSRLVREYLKEKREHPSMTDAEIRQIVRDHEIKRIKKNLERADRRSRAKMTPKQQRHLAMFNTAGSAGLFWNK